MVVRDILSKGGQEPVLDGDEKPTSEKGDEIARIQRSYYEGERLKAFKAGAGIDATPTAPAVKESQSLDVAAVVAAQSALVGTLIGQIVDLVKVKPAAAADPLLSFVLAELKDVRAKADNAPDPLGYLQQSQETLAAITQRMKASLGLPEGMRVGPGDVGGMISLEEAKMEREERQRRWETERDERRRQWEVENSRWRMDFDLKLKEFDRDRESRDNTGNMFGDLIAAVTENLNVQRGVPAAAQPPTQAGAEAFPPPTPQVFPCSGCGKPVTIPLTAQPGQEVGCGGCGLKFRLDPP